MVTGRATVSQKIKGAYNREKPSRFSEPFRPVVFWNITYRCNLRCIHCYISASPEGLPGELDRGYTMRIADQLIDLNPPLVTLTGGEPMVRKDFWDIVGRLRDGGLRVAVSTNGTLINRESAVRLARLGISYVGISLDSPLPAVHNMFRGSGDAFKRAVDGVRNSIEAGLDVGLRMTITALNISEAPDLVELARDMGVKRIAYYLLDLTGRGRFAADIMPTGDQLRSFLDRLIEISTEYSGDPEIVLVRGNFMGIYVADKISRSREEFLSLLNMTSSQGDCGRKAVSIYPDGKVEPCQFIYWIDIGDLKLQTLKEILKPDNPNLRIFLEIYRHLRGSRCSKCPFKQICGGGSRGRALALTGDPWGDDPACIIDPDELSAKWKLRAIP